MKAAHSLQAGDAAAARKGLLKVAKVIPDSAAVWYNLGLANQFLGMHQSQWWSQMIVVTRWTIWLKLNS